MSLVDHGTVIVRVPEREKRAMERVGSHHNNDTPKRNTLDMPAEGTGHRQTYSDDHSQPAQSRGAHDVVAASVALSPAEIYSHIADAGAVKPSNSFLRELVLTVLAGIYIGFGFSLCMSIGGQIPQIKQDDPGIFNLLYGAVGFPFGLTLVVVCGASLFTSNCAYMMAAFIEGKCTILGLLRIWILSYFGNLCGALLLAQFMMWAEVFHYSSESLGASTITPTFVITLAHKKTSMEFGVALCKGILCNWLVCLAVWQANAAQDITGKFVGIWLPISAFVAMGLEHCIANQFVIPLSMMLGSGISVGTFITKNLIPVTIGNIIGGAFFVATSYGLTYGKWERVITDASADVWHKCTSKRTQNDSLPQVRR